MWHRDASVRAPDGASGLGLGIQGGATGNGRRLGVNRRFVFASDDKGSLVRYTELAIALLALNLLLLLLKLLLTATGSLLAAKIAPSCCCSREATSFRS